MLGWEFPPFIAGGLGVACYGLTRALDRLGHEVVFILPKQVDDGTAGRVRVRGGNLGSPRMRDGAGATPAEGGLFSPTLTTPRGEPLSGFRRATFHGVPASFASSYAGGGAAAGHEVPISEIQAASARHAPAGFSAAQPAPHEVIDPLLSGRALAAPRPVESAPEPEDHVPVYDGLDLIEETDRYMRLVVSLVRNEKFDAVHAHDWLTFRAGSAAAKVHGKPFIAHVHSTEYDRSGTNINQRVFEIEQAGVAAADRVIAVSQLTRSILVKRYGVAPSKVDVVYNGIELSHQPPEGARIESADRIVLFLGRITMQKGPEYFIAAAKRVLERMPNVKFVLAGSGDMTLRMIELAASMGIGHRVLFTGFLRGKDVERVFRMADCYVMPSVSEPFGIAALEAISHDVPVILSKTSGASEVLQHVLKVDFWDTDEMANKIIAVLSHPALGQTLRAHGTFELHRLTWEGAAERCLETYREAGAKTTAAV